MEVATLCQTPTPGQQPHDPLPARLAPLYVDTLQRLRLARLCLKRSRERYRAVADALHVAVAMLAEQNQELDRVREDYQALLDERRAA